MAKGDAYTVGRDGDIVRIDYRRTPTREEMLALASELDAMDNSARRLYVMIDTEILLSTADVREGAEYAKSLVNQPTRIAVVARGDITYGISRIFKVFREGPETALQVFRGLEEAKAWLLEDDQPGNQG